MSIIIITFFYSPQDVLATLLNNLKVQERQNRVCTTVAIAIVAETCSPFTVLPALMNEYRVPELNVQNGVLKSLSFLFEYIGEMGKDYIYAVTPLLEDALMDRWVLILLLLLCLCFDPWMYLCSRAARLIIKGRHAQSTKPCLYTSINSCQWPMF